MTKAALGRPFCLREPCSQKHPFAVQVRVKPRPRLSVPVIIRMLPVSLIVAFHALPSAAVPLIIVVFPTRVLCWFQVVPFWALNPFVNVLFPILLVW